MIGMVIATSIAVTRWRRLPIGVAVFVAGTLIRTRAEARLLREQFGASYEACAARVPALRPFAWHAGAAVRTGIDLVTERC